MKQRALTIILLITPGRQQDLENYFNGNRQNITEAFGQSSLTHSAAFTILPSNAFQRLGSRLLFTSNYDGELLDYLRHLSLNLKDYLNNIWNYCRGYADGDIYHRQKFSQFIRSHSFNSSKFASALPGVTVRDISESEALCMEIDNILDSVKRGTKTSFQGAILPNPQNLTVKKNWAAGFFYTAAEYLAGIRKGLNDPSQHLRTNNNLYQEEDNFAQNRMAVIVPIKSEDHLRLLKLVFLLGNIFNRRTSQKRLGRISNLVTIHFARWTITDKGKNFVFEANYDGSWESYIDDFVDLVSQDMNCIWGNCVGFPRLGSGDIESFKQYIRQHQVPSQMYYMAYPNLTVRNILTNLSMTGLVPAYGNSRGIQRYLCGLYQA